MSVNFATFNLLERFTDDLTFQEKASIRVTASATTYKDTFLSHSSKDIEYLPGVIKLLSNHGASVYCDIEDERMPKKPTPETARIIKNQIGKSQRLVLFVTTNSKDSKWVPWELGIGDSKLLASNVALLPAANNDYEQSWAQQEYLGLYRHIVWGPMQGEPKPIWMVYDYRTNKATKLREWLK